MSMDINVLKNALQSLTTLRYTSAHLSPHVACCCLTCWGNLSQSHSTFPAREPMGDERLLFAIRRGVPAVGAGTPGMHAALLLTRLG